MNELAIIALSFAVIVFPTFVVVPSAYGFINRNPRLWSAAIVSLPIYLAEFSLAIAVTFTDIRLLDIHTKWALSLFILISVCAAEMLVFLWILPQYIYEIALSAEYELAQRERTGKLTTHGIQTQPEDNGTES